MCALAIADAAEPKRERDCWEVPRAGIVYAKFIVSSHLRVHSSRHFKPREAHFVRQSRRRVDDLRDYFSRVDRHRIFDITFLHAADADFAVSTKFGDEGGVLDDVRNCLVVDERPAFDRLFVVLAMQTLTVVAAKNAGLEAFTVLLETSRLFARAAFRVLLLLILVHLVSLHFLLVGNRFNVQTLDGHVGLCVRIRSLLALVSCIDLGSEGIRCAVER